MHVAARLPSLSGDEFVYSDVHYLQLAIQHVTEATYLNEGLRR